MIEHMCDTAIDLAADEAGLITQIGDLERRKAAAAAEQALLTAALVARRDAADAAAKVRAEKRRKGLGSEVALARKDSPNRGNQHLGFALALVIEMPYTLAALRSGLLSEWRATILVRESACLSVEDRRTLDAEICADAAKFDGWATDDSSLRPRRSPTDSIPRHSSTGPPKPLRSASSRFGLRPIA